MRDVDEEEEDEDVIASDLDPEEGMFSFVFAGCSHTYIFKKMKKMMTTRMRKMKTRHSPL